MTVTDATITRVLSLVRAEVKRHELPIVTLVAHMGHDPFKVLVATMLSLRTKDRVTAQACGRLFGRATTPRALLSLSESEIARLIYPVGFYRTKAKQLRAVSAILLDKHGGAVPDDIDTLVTLPGVGRKTANLVVTQGYGKPGICVDTHVHRISHRWGYVRTRTPEKTEAALRAKLPGKHWIEYNDLLVSFGQHRCAPVSPRCSDCPLRKYCPRIGVTKSR